MGRINPQGLFYGTGMGGPDDPAPTPNDMPLVEGGNPAWNDVLQYVPEEKRTEVVPKLQEWDQNYQQVQEGYNQWKEFADGGVDPETARVALNMMSMIEQNPQHAYEVLGKHLGVTPQKAQEIVEEETGQIEGSTTQQPDYVTKEQWDNLNQKADAMAQILLAQRQEEEVAQQNEQLDQELADLKDKHGEFPEHEVIYRMLHSDMSAEEALTDYHKFEENLLRQRRSAPRVLSGGGQIPQPKVDIVKASDKEARNVVADMLKVAMEQNQGE